MHDELLLILIRIRLPAHPLAPPRSLDLSLRSYFLAFPEEGKEHLSAEEKADRKFMREGILELCHNVSFCGFSLARVPGGMAFFRFPDADLILTRQWGTENDPEFKGYANGNEEPGRG